MSEVPLNPKTQMSQAPPNQMYPPPPLTYQVPLNQMPQGPMNQMPQPCQVPPNQIPPISQVPLNQRPPVPQAALGPEPCAATCPSCGASIVTSVSTQPTGHTHLMALLLCFLCICLACIPYCTDSCQNADHYCPECGTFLGTYRR